MKLRLRYFACCLLAACASVPVPPPSAAFHDDWFAPPPATVRGDDVFTLSDAMKVYIHRDIARELRTLGTVRGLVDALHRQDRLTLEYDASATRNAAQAFAARKGNCLSLAIMTAALAKELGLDVTFQSVRDEDTWSRGNGTLIKSTHVNITLARLGIDDMRAYDSARELTIDFLPAEDIRGQRRRPITEETVVAMYMNNRAVEALERGQTNEAYWWARNAAVRAPEFTSSLNTLGIVYLRHHNLAAAEFVLRLLMERDPGNVDSMSNLALVLERQGRTDEAAALRRDLARVDPNPPYHYFQLGTAAMQRGDYQAARALFAREVARADYSSEFHFWLGIADFRLGYLSEAREQLALALEFSTTSSDHDLYAAKLERLRYLGTH